MTEQRKDTDGDWHAAWDTHARAQGRRLAALPLADKLQWLEEADDLVRHLREAPHSRQRGEALGRDASGDE